MHVSIIAMVIAFTVVLLLPNIPTPIAKSYSCGSSASGSPSATTSIKGSSGSCSTSSSSVGNRGREGITSCQGPNCQNNIPCASSISIPCNSSSSSSGGSQSSCSDSLSFSFSPFVSSSSQSVVGKCSRATS